MGELKPNVGDSSRSILDRGEAEFAWNAVVAAARESERAAAANKRRAYMVDLSGSDAALRGTSSDDPSALLDWNPGTGWTTRLAESDVRRAVIDLYLPICSAVASRPITIGHLGQSLDGFIATHAGESRWVTGQENLLHMHRLRALCDAVVVGAGTIAADDPQLTTRLVPGPNPLRVVLDPGRRLGDHHRVFHDDEAETLYVCARSLVPSGEERLGQAAVVGLDDHEGGIDVRALLGMLRARGCARVFVEGGGVTVSLFLEAGLLDRLHVAIAPLLIGEGRPAIRTTPRGALDNCHRPQYRVFRMGGDVLFDCDLRSAIDDDSRPQPSISRVI